MRQQKKTERTFFSERQRLEKVADSFDRKPYNDALANERRLRVATPEERKRLNEVGKTLTAAQQELNKIPALPTTWLPTLAQPKAKTVVFKGGDGDKPDAIQQRIRELYQMLACAIDEQIGAAQRECTEQGRNGSHASDSPAARSDAAYGNGQRNPRNGRATGNGRRVTATEAQCRAIHAICKSQGVDVNTVLADYNVSRACRARCGNPAPSL